MGEASRQSVWVAVLVQRGFVSDVRAFREEKAALRREYSWRLRMNPDYDETGVSEVFIEPTRVRVRSRRPARENSPRDSTSRVSSTG